MAALSPQTSTCSRPGSGIKRASPAAVSILTVVITLMGGSSMAQTVPEKLKGTGEVVITSGGGTWEQAQKKAFFDPFERDTGIKVVLVPEDHAKLLASVKVGRPEADITSVPGGLIGGFEAKDAIQSIDYSFFDQETLDSIPDELKHKNGVGALLYSIAVAFNTNTYKEGSLQPRNWVDFYDVAKFPGARSLPKCEKIVDGGLLEGALMGDGVPSDKVYPIDMDRAFAKLAEIKPHVRRWWVAGADAPQSLVDGETDIAAAYNGRIFGAKAQGAPLQLSWEQSLLQYDYWVVMNGSPNRDNAMKFLAYISQAEPQSVFAKTISYGPVNEKAFDLIPEEMHDILPGSPGLVKIQVVQDYTWWNAVGAGGKTNWEIALERCVKLLSQ